jgi:hypothetical protein
MTPEKGVKNLKGTFSRVSLGHTWGGTVFLATDRSDHREAKVRKYLSSEPSLSLLLAAVNFEWTVCRAVLFLSSTPNSELRKRMADYYSLDGYKDLWKTEVLAARDMQPLATIVRNWSAVRDAFHARNRLVHGRDRHTRKMALPHVEALLKAVKDVDTYCSSAGLPLCVRMPVGRRAHRVA